jgi:hypothetical protein
VGSCELFWADASRGPSDMPARKRVEAMTKKNNSRILMLIKAPSNCGKFPDRFECSHFTLGLPKRKGALERDSDESAIQEV